MSVPICITNACPIAVMMRGELLHTLCQRLFLVHCIHVRILKFCISFVTSCVIQGTQLSLTLISLRCGNGIGMLLRFLSLKLKPFILSDCRFVLVRRIFRMMSVIFSQCDTSRNSSLWYPCVTYSIHFQ